MFRRKKTDQPSWQQATVNLHAVVARCKPDEVRHWLRKGAAANEMVSSSSMSYTGNAFHAFAAVRHTDYNQQDAEILQMLQDAGAEVTAVNAMGQSPLHTAARVARKEAGTPQIFRVLVARGAKVDLRCKQGRTALNDLCSDGVSRLEVVVAGVQTLLELGAKIDLRDHLGTTPLMAAARAGRYDVYALLALKGANIHEKDNLGRRASDYAREGKHFALADQIQAREDQTPDTKHSFDSTIVPKVEWTVLAEDRISRTSIEDPIRYKLTEIFNFRTSTYTCITQNLTTKIEAVTVRNFSDFTDATQIDWARVALERKTGRAVPGKAVMPRPPGSGIRLDRPGNGQ